MVSAIGRRKLEKDLLSDKRKSVILKGLLKWILEV